MLAPVKCEKRFHGVKIPGVSEFDLFYVVGTDLKIKSDHHRLLIPNIPLFQYSIIPWVFR